VKSENLSRMSFSQLDKDGDGYLSAEDLRKHFGPAANVSQLIDSVDKCVSDCDAADYAVFEVKHRCPADNTCVTLLSSCCRDKDGRISLSE
jgi:Ca2+-binding EF-hand superfamily protein